MESLSGPATPKTWLDAIMFKYHIPQNNNTEHFKGSFLSQNPNAIQLTNLSSALQRKLLALLEGFTGGSKIRKMSTKT